MIWKSALHYAQFWLVLALSSAQLTAEQEEEILELHNQYRSMVKPEAADMLYMTWNDSLSEVAQRYAAKCIWEHNYEVRSTLGENLFITTSPEIINQSMAKWFEENKHYDYSTNECQSGMCGHYTQMVWAKSKSVGCASHFCEMVENLDYENATILVCNYFPQGNIERQKPYEAGEPCSKCPMEVSECVENTCVPQITEETEEPSAEPDTWSTVTPLTKPVNSAGITKCSADILLLAGLMLSFIF